MIEKHQKKNSKNNKNRLYCNYRPPKKIEELHITLITKVRQNQQ